MTQAMSTGIVFCLSGALALLTCWWLARTLRRRKMVAHPNERSSHTLPTPVGGGVGMLVGLVVGVASGSGLGLQPPSLRLLAAVVVLGAVGLWDDWSRKGAPWALRLSVHIGLAACVTIPLGDAPASMAGGPLSAVLAIAWVVGLLNVVNFMDGIDGIAASQLAISATAVALVTGGSTRVLAVSCVGACVGFLLLNWAPARIFMGDAGSAPFGFLLAAMAVAGDSDWGAGRATWEAVLFVALTLALFVADASVTLLTRLRRGERIWEAHRQHVYQRMVRLGLSHRRVSALYAVGGCMVSSLAVAAWKWSQPSLAWVGAAGAAGAYATALYWVKRRELRRTPGDRPGPESG